MATQRPTDGQRHILQRLCRVAFVLESTHESELAICYTIVEHMTGTMLQAGTREYPVTPIRVADANALQNGELTYENEKLTLLNV